MGCSYRLSRISKKKNRRHKRLNPLHLQYKRETGKSLIAPFSLQTDPLPGELSKFELEILYALASAHPYTPTQIERAYRTCGSFDITILVLQEAITEAVSLTDKLAEFGF